MTDVEPPAPSGDGTAAPPFDLGDYLVGRGVDPTVVARARAQGGNALRLLGQAEVLLGETPSMTPPQVWARAGATEDLARRLWRAMGFVDLPDDAAVLADLDVAALADINDYLASTGVSPETAIRFTRLMGQTMGRVADALLSIVDEGLAEMDALPPGTTEDLMVLAADVVNPLIERELVYLLRRHLFNFVQHRLVSQVGDQHGLVVGFADVVSFTRLSGQLPEGDLADLLERFEATTSEEIVAHGGRVVKLIGDAVLFVFDDAAPAADCALHLVAHFGGDQPDLRVGLAHGPVIDRLGDIFGPTVNLASRLVGFARPGTVVVDDHFASCLDLDAGFGLRSLRPRDLKGIGTTPLHVLRRT